MGPINSHDPREMALTLLPDASETRYLDVYSHIQESRKVQIGEGQGRVPGETQAPCPLAMLLGQSLLQ